MSGISSMTASAKKPAGLDSGNAQRVFQDIQSQRFAAFEKRYQKYYNAKAYMMIDKAADIAKRTGKYRTVYPGKDGTREVDLPKSGILKDTHVIQCYDESSLPKDPAGRQAKLSEMLANQEISQQEFRRLSRFKDLEQSDQLAVALEERVLHDLDAIIEKGTKGFNPPDEFILGPPDPVTGQDIATKLTVQTINKYMVTDLDDERMGLLHQYFTQIQLLKQKAATPPPQASAPAQAPLAVAPPAQSMGPTSGVRV